MERPSSVRFPVTVAQPELQAYFDQGVGQLHGFWYFEAERTFRQIAAEDPECAMAYWGMAMANVRQRRARRERFAREAWLKRDNVDRRASGCTSTPWPSFYEASEEEAEEDGRSPTRRKEGGRRTERGLRGRGRSPSSKKKSPF